MATVVSSFVLHNIEVLIKFLESRMTVFVHPQMSSKLPSQKWKWLHAGARLHAIETTGTPALIACRHAKLALAATLAS